MPFRNPIEEINDLIGRVIQGFLFRTGPVGERRIEIGPPDDPVVDPIFENNIRFYSGDPAEDAGMDPGELASIMNESLYLPGTGTLHAVGMRSGYDPAPGSSGEASVVVRRNVPLVGNATNEVQILGDSVNIVADAGAMDLDTPDGVVINGTSSLNGVYYGVASVPVSAATSGSVVVTFPSPIPAGKAARPQLTVRATSVYFPYVSTLTSTNMTIGCRHYNDISATANIPIEWFVVF